MDELGNNTIQMYQLISIIRLCLCLHNWFEAWIRNNIKLYEWNSFSKDGPAIHEHDYRITKKQSNEETRNIYNIYKTHTYNIENQRYTDEHYYNNETTCKQHHYEPHNHI